jgi:hypothetical protein
VPIACSLHDRLEALATMRRPCAVVFRAPDSGDLTEIYGRIVDVFAREGAEFVRMEDGTTVRLDRLVRVDGEAFAEGG